MSIPAALILLAVSALIFVVNAMYQRKYSRKIMKLCDDIDRILRGDSAVSFADYSEGSMSILTAEIHKMILDEKKRGKTVFLTTHTMTEAEKLCGSIALLNEGRIVEYGRPEEICRRYDHQRRLKIHLKDGSDIEIPHNVSAAGTIAELIGSGKAETIHTTEPDLETVFMELTGKELSA